MKYSGMIFDFNGTLFWDTPLHNKAWNMFLENGACIYPIMSSSLPFTGK